MFNVDNFTNDMSKRSVPQSASLFGGNGKRAILYVFTPSMIPQQILRPYKYDFNGNLIDEIVSARDKLAQSVAPNGLGMTSANVNGAILPNPNGIPLDMGTLSSQWTFVLIIDTVPPAYNDRTVLHSPTRRIIATGFCSDEPINKYTNTINPNAVLMFTKSNMTYVTPSYGEAGHASKIRNASDLDVVSELNAMIAPTTPLYVGTPQDIRGAVSAGVNGETFGTYGDLCLNNIKQDQNAKLISGQLKTPKAQLGDITRAIDHAINFAMNTQECVQNPLMPSSLEDPADLAKDTFNTNVRGSVEMLPRNSIDTSKPMSMGNLTYIFPDLEVVPCEIPVASAWDTTTQDAMTARNSMSSMLSASLSALVPSCGLSDIMFRYASYTHAGPSAFDFNQGTWEILKFNTLVECSPRVQQANVEMFEHYFETQLVPILKLIRGDFDLMAYIDVCGYILIDLNYKADFGQQLGSGFYETSSRLGGFINPMVMDLDTINHNSIQLDALVTGTIGKKIGFAGMSRPLFESEPEEFYGLNGGNGIMHQPVAYDTPNTHSHQPAAPSMPRGDYSNLL